MELKDLDMPPLILLGWRGSHAHGTASQGADSICDKDLIGVTIPPLDYYLGCRSFSKSGTQEIKEGIWDIVIYDFVKYIDLCCKGNPSALSLLWLSEDMYEIKTKLGEDLIKSRDLFSTMRVVAALNGFASRERANITKKAGDNSFASNTRQKLFEKHGYDTKAASHLIRLQEMLLAFLQTGKLMIRDETKVSDLRAIKFGKWSLADVMAKSQLLSSDIWDHIYRAGVMGLPNAVNLEEVNKLKWTIAQKAYCLKQK